MSNFSIQLVEKILHVIDKGYFSEAFLFKPRGGRSPLSDLNRKPREILSKLSIILHLPTG